MKEISFKKTTNQSISWNWFKSILLFTTLLSCSLQSQANDVTFNRSWVEYDVVEDGQKGIRLHCDLYVQNHQGEDLLYKVWFGLDDDDRSKWKFINSTDSKYSYRGLLGKKITLEATYQNSHWKDLDVFVPYRLFPSKSRFLYQIYVMDIDEEVKIGTTGATPFVIDINNTMKDILDNTEYIKKLESDIARLVNEKKNCSQCHGSGNVRSGLCFACQGSGVKKVGYTTPQFYSCNYCEGTGKTKTQCLSCKQRSLEISISTSSLARAKETHGMDRETYNSYLKVKGEMARMDNEWRRTVNDMCEPYLKSTYTSSSSSSSSSSHSQGKCSICGGTGYDPTGFDDAVANISTGITRNGGGYTHSSGSKCPYCGHYEWHFHPKCPKCR